MAEIIDPIHNLPQDPHTILFFDGHCNLCHHVADFIARWDKKHAITLLSLQSEKSQEILLQHGKPSASLDSVLLLHKGKIHERSAAVLRTFRLMGFPWKLLYVFIIVPTGWRDLIYAWIARNRYQWFGAREKCSCADAVSG